MAETWQRGTSDVAARRADVTDAGVRRRRAEAVNLRPLGTTGVDIAPLVLGAMNFGIRRRRRSRRSCSTARSTPGSASSTPPTSTARASRSWATRSPRADGATRCSSPPRSACRAARARPSSGTGGSTSSRRATVRCAASYRPHRPLPTAPAVDRRAAGGDARGARRARRRRQGAMDRFVDVRGVDGGGRAGDGTRARPARVRERAASVQPARPAHRERAAPDVRAIRARGAAVVTARRGSAQRPLRLGRPVPRGIARRARPADPRAGHRSRARGRVGPRRTGARRAGSVPRSSRSSGSRTSRV